MIKNIKAKRGRIFSWSNDIYLAKYATMKDAISCAQKKDLGLFLVRRDTKSRRPLFSGRRRDHSRALGASLLPGLFRCRGPVGAEPKPANPLAQALAEAFILIGPEPAGAADLQGSFPVIKRHGFRGFSSSVDLVPPVPC